MIVSGSTGSGKSEWILRFLRNLDKMVTEQIERIIYCYGELNSNVLNLQRAGKIGAVPVTVHNGVPPEDQIRERAKLGKLLLILDDLVVGMSHHFLDTLFTRGSHNWGVSVILVTQHLFNKELRVARNNSHYLVLMRNPAGELQTRTLATHLFTSRFAHFIEAYRDACAKNFGYLLVDMHPQSPEALRLRTHIYGRVPLRSKHVKKLQSNAQLLRRLARTRCSRSAKNLLTPPNQQGGGLPAIAGLVASIVHTKRYLLVPEEIYTSLSQPLDGTPVGLVRSRIQQTKNEGDEINYQQEFKRLNKLSKEEAERPVDVRLQNLEEILPKQTKIMPQPRPQRKRKSVVIRRPTKTKKEEDDDDDDEVWEDASPRTLRSSKTSVSSERPDANYPMTKNGILEHIRQNAITLGVSEDGKILKPDGNVYKTSNFEDIVVHLLNKDKRSQFKNAPDVNSPVSFTSVEPLLREAKARNKQITRRDVQNFLATQRAYTLHRQAKRRYRRLPTLAPGLHTEWQADLAMFDRLSRQNRGSKYVPWKLLTDQGKEFTAKAVQTYFRSKDVEHFCMFTSPQFHAGMAERANRSIKERLYRYFTEHNTQKWIGVVQQLVKAINHSYNSSIGMRPVDVNFKNAEALRQKLYDNAAKIPRRAPKFKVGDRVRIEKYKHVFQKGYLPRFTNELFMVVEVHSERSPVVYRLRDSKNEIIKGWFYANDLCKTLESKDQMHDIEKIIKRKKQHDVEHVLVKWKGFNARYNSWIPASSFNAEWEVGLAVIVYPHSWPSIGTVEEQFVQIDWKTGNTVRISVPPSNVTNPYELSKNLYKLLGEGSEPLAEKVRTAQIAYTNSTSVASKWARQEYINQRTREKRSVVGQKEQFQKDIDTLMDFYGVDEEDAGREKRATSKIPIKRAGEIAESYQKRLDEYFTSLKGSDLKLLGELEQTKLKEEIARMHKDDRAILDCYQRKWEWRHGYRRTAGCYCQHLCEKEASPELLVQFGGYNVFRGIPYQRGGGVGSVFRSLMRYLLPIGKQIGAAIGRQGLESGNRVLTNVLEGKDIKEALVTESKSGGKKAQFLSRVDFDIGNQELYLLNNLDLLFTIYKAKDSFLLQTLLGNDTNKYRLAVHDVKIYAKMIEVQPSFNMSLYKSLEKQPATYAVRKTEIKSSYISAGRYEFEYNVFSATIPRRMTIAMVGNAAFNGDFKEVNLNSQIGDSNDIDNDRQKYFKDALLFD
uniref:Chromo domain-containing protein n=1 Tax=Globodera rostochiensis TaxID=31243 RepID=A0A914I6D7_GLORO